MLESVRGRSVQGRRRSYGPPFPACLTSRTLRAITRLQMARLFGTEVVAATLEGVLDVLAPGFCPLCSRGCAARERICESCAAEIRWIGTACPRCGLPLRPSQALHAGADGAESCGSCLGVRTWHDGVVTIAEYEGAWRRLVLLHKFRAQPAARRFLVEQLVEALERSRCPRSSRTVICAVPQHPLKTLLRGRDPCGEIAEELSRMANLRQRRLLRKVRWTKAQVELSRAERRRNLGASFRLVGSVLRAVPAHVILVDDVVTTGTTVSECARVLRRGGVQRIDVLAFARALDVDGV